jgi:hypothetical protein
VDGFVIPTKKDRQERLGYMKTFLSSCVRRAIIALIPLLFTYHTLLFYGFLPNTIFYVVLILFFLAYIFMDWKNSLLLSCSLLGATLLVNLGLVLMKIDNRIYYREHERFTVYNGDMQMSGYKRNVDAVVKMPFGDTYAVGGEKDIETEPRTIRFKTDSLGFRNDEAYRRQKYVLVGDSFVVGSDNSQEDTLQSQLKETYGIDTYSLAYPGGIPEYVKFILYLQRKYTDDFKVLLFLFEGNDFPGAYSRRELLIKEPYLKAFLQRYRAFFRETVLYRCTYSVASKRSKKSFTARVLMVKGHRIADFNQYIGATERETYHFPEKVIPMLSLVRNRIDHIFFIPTKFRVYHPFLETGNQKPLPNAQWEAAKALSESWHIPCTDLTGPLTAESERLLKEDKFTYWKDDSHWNRYGIAVAAKVISGQIPAGH